MNDHWLKIIIMEDFNAALLVVDMLIEYASGHARGIDGGEKHLESLKATRRYLVELHHEYMVDSFHSPFANPEKARWIVKNPYLSSTQLYKKVKNSGKHLKPPGGDGPGGPGPGDGGPPRAGPPPKIPVPGGGFSVPFVMDGLHKLKRAGIITGGSSGFAVLSQTMIGLAGSGSVAIAVAVTAGDKAKGATDQAEAKGQQSELNDYFSYLVEWSKAAWKALSSEGPVRKVAPPLEFTTWLNRRPPKFGF